MALGLDHIKLGFEIDLLANRGQLALISWESIDP
jgi:hypothetical protein